MSKKHLLEESTVRKFMRLANLEPLSDRFIKEEMGGMPGMEEEDLPADGEDMAGGMDDMDDGMDDMEVGMDDAAGDEEMDVELDAGEDGEVSPAVAKKVVQAVLDALGVKGTVEDDEDMGDDSDMGDMDSDMGGEEDAESDSEEGEESEEESDEEESDEEEEELDEEKEVKSNEEREEVEESRLSEDDLVENVLKRVTARLVMEARKAKSVKEKMKSKKESKKLKEEKHTVTHKKSSNLVTKGTNKHNIYKGTPDMEMKPLKGKGGKTGKGGHEMKPLKKSKNHIITHDKNHNKLPSKGTNKS